jgi:hypothetical protein
MKKVLGIYLLALLVQRYKYGSVQKCEYLLMRRLDEESAQFTCFTECKSTNTCFTSTKVQILTQQTRRSRHG